MSFVCPHCKVKKLKNEAPGLCCANEKVKLPESFLLGKKFKKFSMKKRNKFH